MDELNIPDIDYKAEIFILSTTFSFFDSSCQNYCTAYPI
jgi:hypothetical protein